MFHGLLTTWFGLLQSWGYWGVFFLMALESTVVPIPSEVIMPPAGFWVAQGDMNFALVVLAGTLGSWVGASVSYGLALVIGRPLLVRYGRWVRVTEKKLVMAERFLERYEAPGIFFSRLLPVVRHLISIPAGIVRMRFATFSLMTLVGAGIWCTILTWFGMAVIGDRPDLMTHPDAVVEVTKTKLHWFVIGVAVLAAAYMGVLRFKMQQTASSESEPVEVETC